jgi:hypothetical protein
LLICYAIMALVGQSAGWPPLAGNYTPPSLLEDIHRLVCWKICQFTSKLGRLAKSSYCHVIWEKIPWNEYKISSIGICSLHPSMKVVFF